MTVWKEQAVTIPVPGEDLVLEGVWQAGSSRGGVIAPPHPLYGGSLENPVVNELAYGLHRSDVPSLRFNWRGVGASQGETTGAPEAAEADFTAALDQLEKTVTGPLYGCGYSFGAATALRVALKDRRLSALVLVAPPVQMIEALPIAELDLPLFVISGGRDEYAPSARLSELLSPLANARLEVLPKVDHFFVSGGLAEVAAFANAASSG